MGDVDVNVAPKGKASKGDNFMYKAQVLMKFVLLESLSTMVTSTKKIREKRI